MKTIIAPVDFSAITSEVIRAACSLAKATRSRLVLLHVVQIPIVIEPYGIANEAMVEALSGSEKFAARQLQQLAKHCSRRVKTVKTIQYTGQAVPVIIAKQMELKAQFIVIGSHGHGAVYDALIGSVAQGVLRRARCPVLVVPGKRDATGDQARRR
ncbi:MAG: universal stress protein [Opitutaceae bacterium]|nr:universal stress protein [Opitutaceae bacterium]